MEFEYLKPKKEGSFLFDGCKLLWHQDKIQDWLDGKRISPIHIDMGISKSCNMRCIYCYGVKQKLGSEFIPEDRLIMLAKDAGKVGVRSIAVIGDGEPTMNKGLYKFVEIGVANGLDMSVATNGLLLDKTKIELLTRNLLWLRFNISGVNEKYDFIHTTKGGFKKFEQVIQDAVYSGKRNGCTIGLQMVLIPECFDQIIPLTEYALIWGVDYLVIKQFSDGGQGMPLHFDMGEYAKARKDLAKAEGMSNDKTKVIAKWSAIRDSTNITGSGVWDFNRCIDLPFLFQISGNGKCYPCGYMFGNDKYCYGDITRDRLSDVLKSEKYWGIVKQVSETPLKDLCQGQCRHCETNRFMDRLKKVYKGDLDEALCKLVGGQQNYMMLMENPPAHINFV